jgi:hypothetical protein
VRIYHVRGKICSFLDKLGSSHRILKPVEARNVDGVHGFAGLGAPLTEGAVAPETTAVAKSARLDPEAEELFLAFFALQDTLTKETAAVLAQKVNPWNSTFALSYLWTCP